MVFNYSNLWKKLIDKGWKDTNLAEESQVDRTTISKMHKGKSVTMETMAKMAKSLNCSVAEIAPTFNENT